MKTGSVYSKACLIWNNKDAPIFSKLCSDL